jgi:hypothetical protein
MGGSNAALDFGSANIDLINENAITENPMHKLKIVTAAVALLFIAPALAGPHRTREKLPVTGWIERVRNAQASATRAVSWPGGVFRYDEALSPPAGH